MCEKLVGPKGMCLEHMQAPKQFKQGFNPLLSHARLQALNIFSGGGNFVRRLEEGGVIKSKGAVEWGLEQMLTYHANHADPEKLKLFCGSVNDYLAKALHGKDDNLIAGIVDAEFIAASSPCQRYSMVNPNKKNDGSMRNYDALDPAIRQRLHNTKFERDENIMIMELS